MVFLDPNFAKTSTTETPLHFQTPDPQDVTPANGEKSNFLCHLCLGDIFLSICGNLVYFSSTSAGRSRVSVVAVVITFMSVLVVVAFSACFSRCLHQKLNVSKKQIKHKHVVASCQTDSLFNFFQQKLSEGKTTQSQV